MPPPGTTSTRVSVAFMSYAHHDDGDGRLTKFRERLARELRSQTGIEMEIFQDSDTIQLGEKWRRRLDHGLAESTFLLPIVTPSFLTSSYCRDELETFLRHERELDRDDLILPVYYIDCEAFRTSSAGAPEARTLNTILERQYFDWRGLRTFGPAERRVERERTKLAEQIRLAIARSDERCAEIAPDDAPQDSALDDALRACCVRIDVGGRQAGSGFFAAPGIVVTCYHVLRLGDLSSDEASASMSVRSQTGDSYEVLDTREFSEEDDLAILRVEPAHDHPFVLLDTGFRARDRYTTFGFTEEHPDGVAVTLAAQRWIDADRTLKVADAGVGRGISGSPVLNRRTGAVCGILMRGGRRQPTLEAGPAEASRIVSMRRLFHVSPTLSSANFRHHTTHRKSWFGSLPAEQQRLLLAQRTSDPASLPECLLVISVDQQGDEWEVSATMQRRDVELDMWADGTTLGPIKVDLNSVRALVARVFRDWAAAQGRVEPGDQIRLLGEILSRAVLTEEIGETFDTLIAGLDLGWIEVALHFSDDVDDPDFEEFVQLPWEHLYVPPRGRRGDVYFAREPKLALVRTLYPEPVTPEPSAGRISVLVVAVRPEHQEGTAQDVAQREIDDIVSGLVTLGKDLAGTLHVTVIQSPGLHGLEDAVNSGQYDVIHYVGFGRFDTRSGDRVALVVSPTDRSGYHNAGNFAACLEGDCMPRLLVLQMCRSTESVPPDLAVFGPALLMKERCDAVVAYQYPVASALTKRFNTALYTALTEGTPLEMAAQTARKKVWAGDSEGRAFLSPAVFVRNPGGLRLAPKTRETATRSRVGTLSGHG